MPRAMEITTPLGSDVLLFHTMHAREELSRIGECRLDLLSLKNDIKLDDILGKSVTVKVALQDDSTRYFNGYVTRFSSGGTYGRYRRYSATVHPWPWFLSRTADCRIFQDKTVPEIVKIVLEEHPTHSFKTSLSSSYSKWDYCVQYRETDLNFVCRLLEQEGIYFFFTHEDGKHTMVLTDSYRGHTAFQKKAVPFIAPEDLARPDIEHIDSWLHTGEVQSGLWVHTDYDFERPSVNLKTQKQGVYKYAQGNGEIFDYPGEYIQKSDGDHLASARMDELDAQHETVQGAANVKKMSVGSLFTLEKGPRADQNVEHLVVAASYDLQYGDYEAIPDRSGAEYRCGFVAMASKQQFRPKRATPKPFVQGPQTAVVVGPGGEEIYTDKYGRVKVMFHWDRLGKKDENSSCWIRVSHPWAGKAWGAVAIPRIGQEVIVDFLEGDPDQPIITGRVYNAEQMPPYALPANKTQTGIKSRSSMSGSPDNFNEIRFEDKKGSEQVFIHAEKNQDIEVENDETHWVGHDRKKTIDNDENVRVKHDRTEKVDNNETIAIGGSRSESVAKNETIAIEKNRTETVGENESIDIGKDQSINISGNKRLTIDKKESISVGDSRQDQVEKNEEISIGKNREAKIGENDTLDVGKKLSIQAGDQITLQTGSATITMKKDGTITIKGKDITIEGSGKVNVKASSDVVIKGSKVTQN
ncbi:MAG TPA: type VI secretion system tip protein TssI/VgrG [Vicinamibacterales bacterium]